MNKLDIKVISRIHLERKNNKSDELNLRATNSISIFRQ